MSASRRRLALFGATAALAATLVAAAAAEVALRVADYPPANFSPWIRSDTLGFRLAPSISTRMRGPEYDVAVETDSHGFRDDEVGPKRGTRILLLGDSFTMGYGVERPQIFADLLEAALQVEVVNAGTGGYEIVHQVAVLAEHAATLDPDLVLYVLYLGNDLAQNDEWERAADGRLRSLVRDYPVQRPREWKLARLARDFAYGVRQRRGEREGEWLPFEGYLGLCERDLGPEAEKDYRDADRWLGEVAAEADRLGKPLLVLLMPYRSMVEPSALEGLRAKVPDLDQRYDLDRPGREIAARLTARGIPFADATEALRDAFRRSGEPLYFPLDGHLTPAGHAAFAAFAAPKVRGALAELK